jgi:hypothetical protein
MGLGRKSEDGSSPGYAVRTALEWTGQQAVRGRGKGMTREDDGVAGFFGSLCQDKRLRREARPKAVLVFSLKQ